MELQGEIIIIDNELHGDIYLEEVLKRLNYQVGVIYFKKAIDAFNYLNHTTKEIFLIMSEITFDGMNGLQLKKAINEHHHSQLRSIPFVFVTNNASAEEIDEAYALDIHGFFKKPIELDRLTDMMSIIVKYWILNLHPNKGKGFYS